MRQQVWSLAAATALVLTGTAACGSDGLADAPRILRLALNQTEEHPSYIALDHLGERLDERSGGDLRLDIFPNEVLGAQAEVLQLVSDGIVDLAIISAPQMENINRQFRVLGLPLVFDSAAHQMPLVHDPEVVGELYVSLEESHSITVLGGFTQGARHIYASDPIETLDDLRGRKIRVQESEMHLAMVEALGGAPTPMSFGEVYTALQSGVLDGAENNEVSYVTQKHFEVAPFYTDSTHLVGLDFMIASTEMLEAIGPERRALLEEEWVATYEEHTELWESATQDAIAEAEAGGATFLQVDRDAVRAALEPLTQRYLTTDLEREIYEKIRAAADDAAQTTDR